MSRRGKPTIAICYDFDGTLAPGNMQERDFIPAIGLKPTAFWNEVKRLAKENEADEILVYMGLMLERARTKEVTVRKSDFKKYGKQLRLFTGVDDWFGRIDKYGDASGAMIEHYVISSGIREMIEGSPVARHFSKIYASSFWYDHHGVAKWPALALNYTTKTQYLFRINKGSLPVYDHSTINNFVPLSDRPIPFQNMIFIGDGETDIPCFRLVKDQGGHSIAVFQPRKRKAIARSKELLKDGRVNFVASADYSDGGAVDRIVKTIIDKIMADRELNRLRPRFDVSTRN